MRPISQAGGITRQTKVGVRVRVDGGQPRARGGRHVLQSKAKVIAWKKRRCCLASERVTGMEECRSGGGGVGRHVSAALVAVIEN